MDHVNNFNFESLRQLCKEHFQEIKERKNLEQILGRKQVRYIDPEGKFGYTTFGNFYFDSMGVMMLVTKEHPMTWYHRPDAMNDTLWSTVPVIYAGIEIGQVDDKRNHIFTGDVVMAKEHPNCTAMVVWNEWAQFPSLRLDNCDLPLNHRQPLEIIGNIFYDIQMSQYDMFDLNYFLRHNPVCQGPADEAIINENLAKIKKAPSFVNGKPKPIKGYPMIYKDNVLGLKLKEDDILVAFCEDRDYDPDDEDTYPSLYIDYGVLPEECENKLETIPIDTGRPDWDKIENTVNDLLLTIHCNPGTRFILCEFKDSLFVPQFLKEINRIFEKATDYQIRNLVMPFRVALH